MSTNSKPCFLSRWAGTILYPAITAAYVWWLWGFVHVSVLIFCSLVGGLFLYLGLRTMARSAFGASRGVGGLFGGMFVFGLGVLTLFPGWPDDWLVKTEVGWAMLENRAKVLDKAMYNDKPRLVQKIAWAGLGDPAPRDTFGHPMINDAKSPEMLRALLAGGLDPDARDEGGTTLLMRTHDVEMARVLLEAGADPNARDDNGRTPLMYVYNADVAFIQLLGEHGADVNGTDDFGRTVADWLGTGQQIDDALGAFTRLGVKRSAELDFLSHAKREWLDQVNVEQGGSLSSSAVRMTPAPLGSGQTADLEFRLTNESNTDRVVRVEARLSPEIHFVASTLDGKIVNPHEPQSNQEVSWPLLALPARSSGILGVTVVSRNNWAGGDLSVDVRARNVLTYEDEEDIFIYFSQPWSDTGYVSLSDVNEGPIAALLLPFALLAWLVAWKIRGRKHSSTRMAARVVAGLCSILCALTAYSMASNIIRQFTHYEQTEATILDRRYFVESAEFESGASSSRMTRRTHTVLYNIPVVATRYTTSDGEVIATARVGSGFMRENGLGDSVSCWYDRDHPRELRFQRKISIFAVLAICGLTIATAALFWLAFLRRSDDQGSSP
jgi:hypothetical protein